MAIQQGDVRLTQVNTIPQGAVKVCRSSRGYVLAKGEATSHAHVITDPIDLYEHEGVLYLKTNQAVTIQHEEHKTITVSPGIWRIRRIREKDMLEGFVRRVVD